MTTSIMRSADFYSFMSRLDQEVFARDFIQFVLKWVHAEQEEFQTARTLTKDRAICLSKELFPIFVLESMELQNTTRH